MRGTTCCEQDASPAIIRRALSFERIVANTDVATTTYTYDANGNLVQAGGWSYMWDYLNRMLASGYNNSTTTYAYDPSGARVLQTSTTSTTYYPNKYYSFMSTKIGANTYATSTNYIWNGDTLLATIDQPLYNGSATGSPITRYIHPDHLGSTNAVTDQNGSLVQLMDYYPYGATRIATSTYPTNEKPQYIGQFSDAQTSLSYLNARYYNPQQGQFVSQDPVFWADTKQQKLQDPQTNNPYSYSTNNPINKKDTTGLAALKLGGGGVIWNFSLGGGWAIGTTDDGGLSFGPYLDTGPVFGAEVSGPQISTANLTDQYSISTGPTLSGGTGYIGVEISKTETYYPYSNKAPKTSQDASIGPRGGLGGGYKTEAYLPLFTWHNTSQPSYQSNPQNGGNGPTAGASNKSTTGSLRAGTGNTSAVSISNTLQALVVVLQQILVILSKTGSQ